MALHVHIKIGFALLPRGSSHTAKKSCNPQQWRARDVKLQEFLVQLYLHQSCLAPERSLPLNLPLLFGTPCPHQCSRNLRSQHGFTAFVDGKPSSRTPTVGSLMGKCFHRKLFLGKTILCFHGALSYQREQQVKWQAIIFSSGANSQQDKNHST